jgi:predicted alpha/beta-hydrolase family hydrolase
LPGTDAKATPLTIPLEPAGSTTALAYAAGGPRLGATFVLAHGAGAGQQSAWIVNAARTLATRGLDVVTFNFPYTEQKRRIPDRAPVLEACYRRVVDTVRERQTHGPEPLFIGGKSMGGRIATQIAAADPPLPIAGVILLGYPLHPPGRPQQRRDAHLPAITAPILFVQGTRDAFGTAADIDALLPRLRAASIHAVDGGDHSFKIGRAAASAPGQTLESIADAVVAWIVRVRGA